jgi:hypothetical protein
MVAVCPMLVVNCWLNDSPFLSIVVDDGGMQPVRFEYENN